MGLSPLTVGRRSDTENQKRLSALASLLRDSKRAAASCDWDELRASRMKAIYVLLDPRPEELLCYVGQTDDQQRFEDHLRDAVDPYSTASERKRRWLSSLVDRNLLPNLEILEVCSAREADVRERCWIGRFEASPLHILTNGTFDRAFCLEEFGGGGLPPIAGRKPTFVTEVIALEEIYVHEWRAQVSAVLTREPGYRLVRCERAMCVSPARFAFASGAESDVYWAKELGPSNFSLLTRGLRPGLLAADMVTDPCRSLGLRLSDYVPWSLRHSKIPRVREIEAELAKRHVGADVAPQSGARH